MVTATERSGPTPQPAPRGRKGTPSAPPAFPAGGLVSAAAPPLRLPGAHFTVALTFWILGAIGLTWAAPDIARGLFPLPRVAVVTHLFTLGWITTTIMGALYQFLPVALLAPIRSERLAHVSLVLYAPGLALFLFGLLTGSRTILLTGAATFGTGLSLFVGNLVATLKRADERNLSWWSLAGAVTFLVATIVLGVSLAGNLHWNFLGESRFLALGVHLHVAIFGWVMLVVVGVADRLLPMFLLSHGAPEWPGAVAAGMLTAGTGTLLVGHHSLNAPLLLLIGFLLVGGVIAFLAQAALFFRHRKKPSLDPGLRLAAAGLAMLAVGLALAPFFAANGVTAPRIATAYVLALLSALSLFVAGHYYKILPFLIWFHRFGPLVGKQPVPRVVDLYNLRWGNAATALLAIGSLGTVIVTLLGAASVARPVAACFTIGAVIVAAQMFTISRRRP